MRQTDPEADLALKLDAYAREDEGSRGGRPGRAGGARKPDRHHGSLMDARTYGIGAQILSDLGVRNLHLLTNNPKRIQGLEGYGLRITRQMPLGAPGRKDGAASEAARGASGPDGKSAGRGKKPAAGRRRSGPTPRRRAAG
jgi:GTP cyclohydrolase II